MNSKPSVTTLLLMCLMASAIVQHTDARRSRIDLPISLAVDAPISDNVATASGSESSEVRVPAPPSLLSETNSAATPIENKAEATAETSEIHHDDVAVAAEAIEPAEAMSQADAEGVVSEMEEECDPDMIGFEIVTG